MQFNQQLQMEKCTIEQLFGQVCAYFVLVCLFAHLVAGGVIRGQGVKQNSVTFLAAAWSDGVGRQKGLTGADHESLMPSCKTSLSRLASIYIEVGGIRGFANRTKEKNPGRCRRDDQSWRGNGKKSHSKQEQY
jgi:hypothetical protein